MFHLKPGDEWWQDHSLLALGQVGCMGGHGCFYTFLFVDVVYLEPQGQPLINPLFQLDDEPNLYIGNGWKWLFHQTSTLNWLFGVPGTNVSVFVYSSWMVICCALFLLS